MNKEEILDRLFKCETDDEFNEMDDEILKIYKLGDFETAKHLWTQLFMIEEGVRRTNYQKKGLSLDDITDIEYLQKNLFESLKVPLEYLGSQETKNVGSDSLKIKRTEDGL